MFWKREKISSLKLSYNIDIQQKLIWDFLRNVMLSQKKESMIINY